MAKRLADALLEAGLLEAQLAEGIARQDDVLPGLVNRCKGKPSGKGHVVLDKPEVAAQAFRMLGRDDVEPALDE